MWREAIESKVKTLQHPAWGPDHCRRIWVLCRTIAEREGLEVDQDVLFAIAWLHDVGTFDGFACGEPAAECAARGAQTLLAQADFPSEKIEIVARIIREHSFDGPERDTAEARVLRDADMLEFLGPVGIMRLFAAASSEEWIGDKATAVRTARDFCERLPGELYTKSGRAMAEARAEAGLAFIARLLDDAGGLEAL